MPLERERLERVSYKEYRKHAMRIFLIVSYEYAPILYSWLANSTKPEATKLIMTLFRNFEKTGKSFDSSVF